MKTFVIRFWEANQNKEDAQDNWSAHHRLVSEVETITFAKTTGYLNTSQNRERARAFFEDKTGTTVWLHKDDGHALGVYRLENPVD